ncbi:MAG: efflux RND transporter permease subunit [Candidatus Hydrogenedentes bacterium]|nr:efflux RND transporter permease subunit [Candidatus Hydrogenedentota bacterium]
MNLSEIFIRRPIMTTLVMLAILFFGAMAYMSLPVSDLPSVDFPTIQVQANLPGASPETMASSVATPLERQFTTIAGLDSMTSASNLSNTQIMLQFSLDRDIDAAAQDVQAAIGKATRQLPSDMPSPPTYQKVNPADQPILYLALSSTTLPLSTVNEYAETFLAQRISMVSGVAQVQVYGSQKYAVRIQLDPELLAARQLGIDEVAEAVRRGNVNLPTGALNGPEQALTVESHGQLEDAAAYRPLIVAYRNGQPVRLGELGAVLDSVSNDKAATWHFDRANNMQPTRAIVLAVQRQPGTNTVQIVDAIHTLLPAIRAQMPAAVDLHTMFDRSQSIRGSVRDVQFTLALAVVLVVLVIFLFLRNLSATAIPSLALPMSIVGTFTVMYLLGYSVDNLSLMALTLSVGFVVDDAIVMLENIVRHMERGEKPFAAALSGSKEIGFTILSMTLSLVAVFIPVLFMKGILGRLLHEFAVTISVAILVSGIVSLSLTPMLASRFLRPSGQAHHGRIYAVTERLYQGMVRLYEWTLRGALAIRPLIALITVGLLVATVYLYLKIPKGFIPTEDIGFIFGVTESAQGTAFEAMKKYQSAVTDVLRQEPTIEAMVSSVGVGGPNAAGNAGRMFMRLQPHETRTQSADDVIEELRPKLAAVPGIQAFLQVPPMIRIGGQLTKSMYQFTLQSPDIEELYSNATTLEEKLRKLDLLQDVTSDLQVRNPELDVRINRDKASTLGLTAEQVEDALYTAFGSRRVSTIFAANNDYDVLMELAPAYQRDPSALELLYLRTNTGQLAPLATVAALDKSVGPMSINHSGQLPAVTLSFNLRPGVALSQAVDAVQAMARETLPDTISTSFQGTARAFQSSLVGLGALILLAILVIYIVLGILYESFIHPITILSGLPSAGFGALLTLMLFRRDLDLYGFVGIIMLIGIVKKNAIMMIDFALDAQRKEGRSPAEAIYQGCLIRFRPIMMTTMAALMGTLPIALGFGAGADTRRPLGLAVGGGLVVSQLMTLYITPVVYVYLDAFQTGLARLFGWKRAHGQESVDEISVYEAK